MTEMFYTPGEDKNKKIEGLGITREDYTKAINECIFGEEEPVNKDLEEEIKKMQRHYKTIEEYDGQYAPLYASDIEHIARHFAGWQKVKDQFQIDMAHDGGYMEGQDYAREQMMKDVVEIPLHQWLPALLYDKMSEKGFKDGDKVKLIIIKEE